MIRRLCFFSLTLALACAGLSRAAEGGDANEAKLREALRNALLQLRSAETERATLQNTQAALTEEKKVLEAKFETLRKETVAERATTDKAMAALKAESAAQAAEIAKLKEALEQADASGKQAAALAATKETDRAQLATELVVLQRKVEDREMKNLALFKLGNEILTRYEKFSLGEALAAREPFVGTTRAKLETLVQDYQDKLLDQRAKP
jgi:chromosome segregation ATPase